MPVCILESSNLINIDSKYTDFFILLSCYNQIWIMQTEIIKTNSQKQSILGLFQNLKTKFKSKKDYDITVIVKQCDDKKRTVSPEIENSARSYKNERSHSFQQDSVAPNQDIQFSSMNLDDSHRSSESDQTVLEKKMRKLVNKFHIKRRDTAAVEYQQKQAHMQEKKAIEEASTSSIFDRNKLQIEERNLEQQQAMEQTGRYSIKLNNQELKEGNQSASVISEGENDSEAGFLIENYLNQAMEFVEKEKYNELEDFLYSFKEKYTFVNLRSQAKWSLLMAHCKEGKLEFERAATNYNQVIETLKAYPTIIMVELGDIYNHLGLCFFQIREWNKAITAYSSALSQYKSSKKCIEYANCIANLGVLYLEINYFAEAEKCLLMAYTIKHKQYDERHRQGLLSILFNLFDCNLKIRNYHQCESILKNISFIMKNLREVDVRHQISYDIKKSKLYFMKDKLNEAFSHCQRVFEVLNSHKVDSKQIAQVFQLMGIIKQDMHQLQKSRGFFEKALKAIQKYVPGDSIQIQILKKKIETLNQKIRRHKSSKKKALQMNPFACIYKK